MKVLIAGGGIAGLVLAQGLSRSGIECEVFEREPRGRRRSGYRLTLDGDGGNALEACLAPDLYELYLRASNRTPRRVVAVVIDSQCNELTTAPHIGPPNEGERPHTAVDRRTFSQLLMAGLDDVLHHDRGVEDFDAGDGGVRAKLSDGSTVDGDVLVGADGVGSAVRRRLLPDVQIIPAPVGALGLFARSPVSDEILAELPEVLFDGFVIARDDHGVMLTLGLCVPREPADRAAAEVAPYAQLEATAPYMQLSGAVAPGTPLPSPSEWTRGDPAAAARGDEGRGCLLASGAARARRADRARDAVPAPVPAP